MSRDAVPKQFSSAKVARRRSSIIIGAVLFAAASGPLSVIVAGRANAAASQANETLAQEDDILHQAFAEAIAHRWAYGEGEILAVAGEWADDVGRPGLTPDLAEKYGLPTGTTGAGSDLGVRHIGWESADVIEVDDQVLEIHEFVLLTDTGMFQLAVPITETAGPVSKPLLGGSPSVSPYVVRAGIDQAKPADWPAAWEATNTPTNIAEVVREWASAYATDDQRGLFRLAGETDDAWTYRGLGGGFSAADVALGRTARRPDGLAVTRATVTFTSPNGLIIRSDYDLLIGRPDEPVPTVTSWGARGTGPVLAVGEVAVPAGSAPMGGYGATPSVPASAATSESNSDIQGEVTE